MFKLIVVAGVAGLARAQTEATIGRVNGKVVMSVDDGVEFDRQKSVNVGISGIRRDATAGQAAVGALDKDVESLSQSLAAMEVAADAVSSSTDDIPGLTDKLHEAQGALDGVMATAQQSLDNAKDAFEEQLVKVEDEIEAALNEQFEELRAELVDMKDDIHNEIGGNLDEVAESQGDLHKETDELLAEIAKHENCASTGHLYNADEDKCTIAAGTDEVKKNLKPKFTWRGFHNADGRDSGWVTNHYIVFKKRADDSYVRVTMQNNFRVHGHIAHAIWHLMFCDEKGNDCQHCAEPNRLNHYKWAGHQHNWWVNDHVGCSIHGICKKTDGGDLRKGTYQIKLKIEQNRYDIYTGHNSHNYMFVDEVFVDNM